KAINAFGNELEDTDIDQDWIDSIVSSNPTVAYLNSNNEIVPRKEGLVTFTVKFDESTDLKDVDLTVEVKAKQSATSIKADNIKVETANGLGYAEEYTVLDQ